MRRASQVRRIRLFVRDHPQTGEQTLEGSRIRAFVGRIDQTQFILTAGFGDDAIGSVMQHGRGENLLAIAVEGMAHDKPEQTDTFPLR